MQSALASALGAPPVPTKDMSCTMVFESEDRAVLDTIIRARADLSTLVPDPYEDSMEFGDKKMIVECHRLNAHSVLHKIRTPRPPCEFLARFTQMHPGLRVALQFVTADFSMCGWAHIANGRVEKCRLMHPGKYADEVLWSLPTHHWIDTFLEHRGAGREGSQRDAKPEMSVFTLLPRA